MLAVTYCMPNYSVQKCTSCYSQATGLEKNLNSSFPFREVTLKNYFTCPGQVLVYFFYLVDRWPAWALSHWAIENKKLPASTAGKSTSLGRPDGTFCEPCG